MPKQKHLHYLDCAYDDNNNKFLYYVAFNYNGKELHWYPRWSQLDSIMRGVWITEEDVNGGKLSTYLALTCLGILLDNTLKNETLNGDGLRQLKEAITTLKQSLIPRGGRE